MRKALLIAMMVMVVAGWGINGEAGAAKLQTPTVELERVEIQSYFPWAEKPTRVPLVLAFIFRITNPNSLPMDSKPSPANSST
jgi:hypothetical protein